MRVSSINNIQQNKNNKPTFTAVYFTDYNNEFSHMKYKLQQEMDTFIASRNNVSPLGAGKFGETFRFRDPELRHVVLKQSKGNFVDTYENEYNNLIKIPNNKIGGQAGIARAYDTNSEKYFLLSTLAEGKEISIFNKYKATHLRSLFNKMFELDKRGIYHGDLNGKNILLTSSGEVNFIDYQWSQVVNKMNFFDNKKCNQLLLPQSILPENAQMFEMATMPYYIEKFGFKSDKESFLRMYLQNKAEYHAKRYNYISQLAKNWPYPSELSEIRKGMEAERAKAKIYRNPSDNVLKVELKKIQFLSDYRDAYGHVDPNILDRNILASPSAYLCSMSAVQDYRKEIAKQMNACCDADMMEYLKSQMIYGDYWYENLNEFTSDTFDYVMRAIDKKTFADEVEHNFYTDDRNPRVVKPNRDVLKSVDSRFQTEFDKNFDVPYGLREEMHSIYSEPLHYIKSSFSLGRKGIHKYKKVKHAYKELKDCHSNGKVLDLLNTAELITLKIREFFSYSYHNLPSSYLDSILSEMRNSSVDFTKTLFSRIHFGLLEDTPNRIMVQGYKNMRKFIAKL